MRYGLADHEWAAIKPMLPNKPRGSGKLRNTRNNGEFFDSMNTVRLPSRSAEGRDMSRPFWFENWRRSEVSI